MFEHASSEYGTSVCVGVWCVWCLCCGCTRYMCVCVYDACSVLSIAHCVSLSPPSLPPPPPLHQTEKDILLREELEALATEHKNFSLWYAVDKGSEGECVVSHGECVVSHGECVVSHGEHVTVIARVTMVHCNNHAFANPEHSEHHLVESCYNKLYHIPFSPSSLPPRMEVQCWFRQR